jgi:hypothetical protein
MGAGYKRKTGGVFLVVGTVQHECTDCGDVKLFTAPPEFSVQEKNGEFYSDCAVHSPRLGLNVVWNFWL